MKQAYITLLSSVDYLPAVLILNRNLKELKCENPLVVLVTDDIFDSVEIYLNKECIEYRKIPVIQYDPEVSTYYPETPSVMNTASKLNIFNLEEFDKVVYIDADSYFLKPINKLFNYPDGAIYDDVIHGDQGFSGMFVCCPVYHNFDFYKTILLEYKLLDGDLFSKLWFPYYTNKDYHIPSKYFMTIMYDGFDKLKSPKDEIYGVHFCYIPKPWLYHSFKKYLSVVTKVIPKLGTIRTQLLKIYFEHYIQSLFKDYPELFK